METILIILTVGTLNVACFFIGAKVGQKVAKGETIETPNVNPIQYIQEQREKQQAIKEQKRINTILENIDNYNGTDAGQKDVPR